VKFLAVGRDPNEWIEDTRWRWYCFCCKERCNRARAFFQPKLNLPDREGENRRCERMSGKPRRGVPFEKNSGKNPGGRQGTASPHEFRILPAARGVGAKRYQGPTGSTGSIWVKSRQRDFSQESSLANGKACRTRLQKRVWSLDGSWGCTGREERGTDQSCADSKRYRDLQ